MKQLQMVQYLLIVRMVDGSIAACAGRRRPHHATERQDDDDEMEPAMAS
jgi:hypothetical protein